MYEQKTAAFAATTKEAKNRRQSEEQEEAERRVTRGMPDSHGTPT